MDPAGLDGSSRGGDNSPHFQRPYSYQHLQPPGRMEWGRRHSEPRASLPRPWLGLTRRASEPTYLPSVAVGWDRTGACWDSESGMEELAGKSQEISGSSWKSLSPSADGSLSYSQESQPKSNPVAPLQSPDLEREQNSRDIVCGICMDKVWDKPEAERIFGILPNCTHAYCLGCLRTWRKKRQGFPLDVIKSCPQCRVHSSYIIPYKFWVSTGAEKEQLIRNFKAWTGQIPCRFFIRGNGHCPFKSDCIYLHQLPTKAPSSGPPWPERMQLVPGNKVLGPTTFSGGTEQEDEVFVTDCVLTMAFCG
ncbi:probable E3 ubiquitin-protein ligase makorin-1 isoform X2 [Talpa occidentalis]|uniref:probable E3 ubiquitin-protein ligase makorin-1 isoform X2 n=1 Tax=Talpa occidentalis TaxID=50954 RepID=UPI0023F6EA8F|nr:probable E3 ubiquitin-protein ligase makorin-1 isoform X2 [Talpa occidentalis]